MTTIEEKAIVSKLPWKTMFEDYEFSDSKMTGGRIHQEVKKVSDFDELLKSLRYEREDEEDFSSRLIESIIARSYVEGMKRPRS